MSTPSREFLLAMNAALEGTDNMDYDHGPEIIEDVNGIPNAVAPGPHLDADMFIVHVSPADLEAAGLTAADVPNLEIHEDY